jgi:hypothetical protein
MSARILAAAGLALVLTQAPAFAGEPNVETGAATAVAACQTFNTAGPVELVGAVEDGLGDFVVWSKDANGDLWLCNANSEGAVFVNTKIVGDLISGDGAALIGFQAASNSGRNLIPQANPADVATALCAAVGGYIEDMQVVATVEDGLGDYLVWLKNADEALWMCNASADAKLYDFEPVDLPLNGVEAAETRTA